MIISNFYLTLNLLSFTASMRAEYVIMDDNAPW